MELPLSYIPRRTALFYLLIAAIWILFSDTALALLISPETQPQQFARGQTVKGWLFVIVTAALLYLLLQHQLERLRHEMVARFEAQQQLEVLLQAMPLAVVQMDPDGRVQYWNRPAEEIFGWSAEDVIGLSPPYTLPEQEEETAALRRRVLAGEHLTGVETRRQTRDGAVIHASVSTAPVRNATGEITSMMSVIEDVTERKVAEAALHRLNAELEQRVAERTAQLEAKNKELETFAYSVSHDLKAPLRGIDGYSRFLQEDYAPLLDEEGQTFLANIRRATGQMSQLIDDLLTYSRLDRQKIRRVPIDLAQLVQTLLAEQQETITARAAKITLKNVDVTVMADPDGLAMALRNLLDNALKFTHDTKEPAVEIGCKVTSEGHLIWVQDNGVGFDMQFQERIFEIFQRLHRAETYPGTGVGLALVRRAMARAGGTVWAESEPGKGATFYLQIPEVGR